MSKITGYEPIYPDMHDEPQFSSRCYGLTIRQHFAAMAMYGILSNPRSAEMIKEQGDEKGQQILARASVYAADALIAELNKS